MHAFNLKTTAATVMGFSLAYIIGHDWPQEFPGPPSKSQRCRRPRPSNSAREQIYISRQLRVRLPVPVSATGPGEVTRSAAEGEPFDLNRL